MTWADATRAWKTFEGSFETDGTSIGDGAVTYMLGGKSLRRFVGPVTKDAQPNGLGVLEDIVDGRVVMTYRGALTPEVMPIGSGERRKVYANGEIVTHRGTWRAGDGAFTGEVEASRQGRFQVSEEAWKGW
jgi:hypothetical protein